MLLVFFFKQKTAYEMRISDWSSDVCSSDLCPATSHGTSPDNPDGPCAARIPAPSALPGEPCRGGASSPFTASKVPLTPRTAHCPARCSAHPKKPVPGKATEEFRQFFSRAHTSCTADADMSLGNNLQET